VLKKILAIKKNQLFFFSLINDTADKISVSCLSILWVSRGVKPQPGVFCSFDIFSRTPFKTYNIGYFIHCTAKCGMGRGAWSGKYRSWGTIPQAMMASYICGRRGRAGQLFRESGHLF